MLNIRPNDGIYYIDEFLKDSGDEKMSALALHAGKNDLNDSEILHLAKGLAGSGKSIRLNIPGKICDIPSTGGPSSLSTLLCPLYLKISGCTVLKLGVPGRPAGGIDVLGQIEGYNTMPDIEEVTKWISQTKYVHFAAGDAFTPLDAKLFQYRKKNGFLDVPCLVIASLLSKKIAVGLNCVGLDIRVSEFGNFGKTWEAATRNAERFNRIAKMAGIESRCFLTNGSEPQQPYIGRGEALVALYRIFNNDSDTYLRKHTAICFSMAVSVAAVTPEEISGVILKKVFLGHIAGQGGSEKAFDQKVQEIVNSHIYSIHAENDGILTIDLENIRYSIVQVQNQCKDALYPDPCGMILKIMPNGYIKKGAVICTYRCREEYREEFEKNIRKAFRTSARIVSSREFEEIA